jgi:hypothetical protein
MSANAAVVAEAIDRSKKAGRAMPLQAASPIRTERPSTFNPTEVMNAWLALPTAWLGAAQSLGRLASPDLAREAMISIADRQLQAWQMMLHASHFAALLKEQSKAAETVMKAWQPVIGEPRSRSVKSTKAGKAA